MATSCEPPLEQSEEQEPTTATALVPFSTDVEVTGESLGCFEPLCRFYHFMHTIGVKAYLYGGFFSKTIPRPIDPRILSSSLHIFDPSEKKWMTKKVDTNELPSGYSDAASTVFDGNLYTYGGTDLSGFVSNHLYQLDIKSMMWNRLTPVNPEEGPIPKVGSGMVAFAQNLGVFGGYGIRQQYDNNSDESASTSLGRRTNEFHLFDLESACWFSIPPSPGNILPPPCSHFTLTQIDSQQAILFGGYSHLHGYLNAIYIFTFKTMTWTRITCAEGTLWPEERHSHAACCLSHNGLFPHLLVTGGQGNQRKVFSDAWLFNIKGKKWTKLSVTPEARRGHRVTAIPISPLKIRVITFGGSPESWSGNQDDEQLLIARTRSFIFELNDNNEWVLISEAYLPNIHHETTRSLTHINTTSQPSQRVTSSPIGDVSENLQIQICLSESKTLHNRQRAEAAERELIEDQEEIHALEVSSQQRIHEIEENIGRLQVRLQETSQMVKREQNNLHMAELKVLDERRQALDYEERVYKLEMKRDRMMTSLEQSRSNVSIMQAKVDELTKCIEDKGCSDVEGQENLIEGIRREATEKIAAAERRTADANQRMKEVQLRLDAANERITNAEHTLKHTENETAQALREANLRVHSLELENEKTLRTIEEVEGRIHDSNQRAARGNDLIQEKEARIRELDVEIRLMEEQRQRTNLRIRDAISRTEQAEETIDELQSTLNAIELTEREREALHDQTVAQEQRCPSWEVSPQNVEIGDEILGVGGWGEVRVARLTVAAKQLHSVLVYDYHQRQFRREMCMAARVSHPNLIRFMGARVEGQMTIVTERMPTSLRALVEQGRANGEQHLPYEHIISISIDVTCALNYLHLMTPDPIIHRDLSSANVLLQPTSDGGWLAKVSDYGTVAFQRLVNTEHPGSVVYEAPEARNPSLQSPKMDIYSFGVLLVEMCTCEFPDPEHRTQSVRSIVFSQELVTMILRCLNDSKDLRPTAAQLVELLKSMQR